MEGHFAITLFPIALQRFEAPFADCDPDPWPPAAATSADSRCDAQTYFAACRTPAWAIEGTARRCTIRLRRGPIATKTSLAPRSSRDCLAFKNVDPIAGYKTRRTVLSWSVRQEAQKEKILDRAPFCVARNGVRHRNIRVRKSRCQCPNSDAAHSRDDRGRYDAAHRDADPPKAIGISLIDTVRDQHHSQS